MWPDHILTTFSRIPPYTSVENKYYGVYDKILNRICFPEDRYTVEPFYALPSAQTRVVELGELWITFVVTDAQSDEPILLLEIKPPAYYIIPPCRVEAEDQMRNRFATLFDLITKPYLYGISIMGQHFAVYRLTVATGEIEPSYIPRDETLVSDAAPQTRWEHDVTTPEGFAKWMEVVAAIREMTQ